MDLNKVNIVTTQGLPWIQIQAQEQAINGPSKRVFTTRKKINCQRLGGLVLLILEML